MKHAILLCILLVLFASSAFSCGNEYEDETYTHTDIEGKTTELGYDDWTSYYFNHGFDIPHLKSRKEELENKIKKSGSYKDQSDLALVLLKLGEKKRSLNILRSLIKKYPNEYNVVANLGTAYELNGKNDSALYYIKRAVEINPDSHKGSEWIHVKILEAKLQMEKDPNWLKRNSILGLNVRERVLAGEKPDEQEHERLLTIRRQLAWQLTERIAFVAPRDPVVADLLFDLANLVALTGFLEHSVYVYNQSMDYAPASVIKVVEVRDEVNKKIRYAKIRKYVIQGISALILIVVAVWGIKKWRKSIRERKAARKNKVHSSSVNV